MKAINKTINKAMGMIALAIIASATFTACEKDEETKSAANPVISEFELGLNNTNTAYRGTDLHIEATIVAEGKIEKVIVDIHPEGDATWSFTKTYTDGFQGLKNTLFHKHIDIPAEADTGDYHFHFSVVDQAGNSTEIERDLEIKEPTDDEAPVITIDSSPTEDQSFSTGDTIRISGTVTDNLELGGMYIGLVKVSQGLTNPDVKANNTITILHTHDFDSDNSHDFSPEIIVGATEDNNITPKVITGEWAWETTDYYILVKSKDASGNWAFSARYPIQISID